MNNLPQPLTPPDCDLTGYRWMPLDVVRVIDSDTFGLSTGDEFKTAFRLWAKSWLQIPAASLPNDDRLLAHLAGLEVTKWRKQRGMALRGWILCADGRLYHPVIAEKALEAMERQEAYVEKEQNTQTRQERHRERRKEMFERLRAHGITVAWDTKTIDLERLVADLPDTKPVTQTVTGASQVASQPVTKNVTPETSQSVTCNAPATASTRTRTVNKPNYIAEVGDAVGTTKDGPPASATQPSPMSLDWQPSPHVAELARQSGMVVTADAIASARAEFVSYWLARPSELRTQHEWDHALLRAIRGAKLSQGNGANREATRSETRAERRDRERAETVAALTGCSRRPAGPDIIDINETE